MKQTISKTGYGLLIRLCLLACLFLVQGAAVAQDNGATATAPKPKPVKNTFENPMLIDAQTVMVPTKGSFEMVIQHRFGTVQNGYPDFWGLFSSSNIRIGFGYAPVKNLYLGLGLTKEKMLWDGSAKYAILKQTNHGMPVSVTYYGNMAFDSRKDANKVLFTYSTQRLSYFNQIIVARKINSKLSLQVAASVSHQNSVNGYYTQYDTVKHTVFKDQKFDLFALSVCARYKLTNTTSFIVDYDQPLTKQPTANPHPNIAFGFEFNTSGHTFQLFAGNYTLLNPQQNSLYNKNNPFGYTNTDGTKVPGGQFVIGFNITRLWNF